MANVSGGYFRSSQCTGIANHRKTEEFFRNLGLKTRLDEAGIGDDTIEEIVRRFNERGAAYGEDGDVTGEVARQFCKTVNRKRNN